MFSAADIFILSAIYAYPDKTTTYIIILHQLINMVLNSNTFGGEPVNQRITTQLFGIWPNFLGAFFTNIFLVSSRFLDYDSELIHSLIQIELPAAYQYLIAYSNRIPVHLFK